MYATLKNLSNSVLCIRGTEGKSLSIGRSRDLPVHERDLKCYAKSINVLVESKLLKLEMAEQPIQDDKESTVKQVSNQTKPTLSAEAKQIRKKIKELASKFKASKDNKEKLELKNQINELKLKLKEN